MVRQETEITLIGLTPEERLAYSIVVSSVKQDLVTREESRIRGALKRGGAELASFNEVNGEYVVRWIFDGEEHRTIVRKQDLTVTSAGFCLSGKDSIFDLASIISVVKEKKERESDD